MLEMGMQSETHLGKERVLGKNEKRNKWRREKGEEEKRERESMRER